MLLITIVGIGIVAFGAYLTIAYLAQSGEAKFAGVQMTLPFGVIVMIVGVVVIAFPYTPLYKGTDNPRTITTSTVSPNTSSVSISPTSTNPPTTISKEQEESRKNRLLSVIPDKGIR